MKKKKGLPRHDIILDMISEDEKMTKDVTSLAYCMQKQTVYLNTFYIEAISGIRDPAAEMRWSAVSSTSWQSLQVVSPIWISITMRFSQPLHTLFRTAVTTLKLLMLADVDICKFEL
ncbi:hypothetical protein RJT34_17496 [Clitoria ternatea]|uniref:Uncharacterized protein n=1 Tax=Clitoria ternatea TaxID=43366 RepID=A0AAN9J9G1_CLITE